MVAAAPSHCGRTGFEHVALPDLHSTGVQPQAFNHSLPVVMQTPSRDVAELEPCLKTVTQTPSHMMSPNLNLPPRKTVTVSRPGSVAWEAIQLCLHDFNHESGRCQWAGPALAAQHPVLSSHCHRITGVSNARDGLQPQIRSGLGNCGGTRWNNHDTLSRPSAGIPRFVTQCGPLH